ncbi:3854_t:CDS:2 [Diversispora eburnea]|uniref:3854_t:CDS:1 n=1 Tax=Diversispora eburnea TaxID=1213867 RepID=A0A9N9FNX1_9GLOM|nr:3854_t:CDS:2 [Diversispora eburnea]
MQLAKPTSPTSKFKSLIIRSLSTSVMYNRILRFVASYLKALCNFVSGSSTVQLVFKRMMAPSWRKTSPSYNEMETSSNNEESKLYDQSMFEETCSETAIRLVVFYKAAKKYYDKRLTLEDSWAAFTPSKICKYGDDVDVDIEIKLMQFPKLFTSLNQYPNNSKSIISSKSFISPLTLTVLDPFAFIFPNDLEDSHANAFQILQPTFRGPGQVIVYLWKNFGLASNTLSHEAVKKIYVARNKSSDDLPILLHYQIASIYEPVIKKILAVPINNIIAKT